MKKIQLAVFILLSIALLSLGLYLFFGKYGQKTTGKVLRLGRYYWPGEYWHEIAAKKGWFKAAGLNVELIDTNADYYQSHLDVVTGDIDLTNFYLYDFLTWKGKKIDLVAILEEDISAGSESLVSKVGIEKISDLMGKRVGVSQGSNLEYLLNIILERSGMTIGDIIVVDTPTEMSLEEFDKRSIDAFIAWEPYPSIAIKNLGARKLWDSSEIPGISRAVLVGKRNLIENRSGDIQALINVWHKTTKYIKQNPEEAYEIISSIYNVSTESVKRMAEINLISDLEINKKSFLDTQGFGSLQGSSHKIMRYLVDTGKASTSFENDGGEHNTFFNDTFINNIK